MNDDQELDVEEFIDRTPIGSETGVKRPVKREKSRGPEYVTLKIPYDLARAKHSPDLAVLVELQHIYFRQGLNPVTLGNKNLGAVGIDRWAKMVSLKSLRKIGLIDFEVKNGCSPTVTLKWLPLEAESRHSRARI
jgi:hypothetical protein